MRSRRENRPEGGHGLDHGPGENLPPGAARESPAVFLSFIKQLAIPPGEDLYLLPKVFSYSPLTPTLFHQVRGALKARTLDKRYWGNSR